MGRPVALKGHMHVCPKIDPGPKPHVGGPVTDAGQSFVTVDGVPIATVGGKALCSGALTSAGITGGSSVATINGKKIARIGDSCEHGGNLIQGALWLTFE